MTIVSTVFCWPPKVSVATRWLNGWDSTLRRWNGGCSALKPEGSVVCRRASAPAGLGVWMKRPGRRSSRIFGWNRAS